MYERANPFLNLLSIFVLKLVRKKTDWVPNDVTGSSAEHDIRI